MGKEDTEYDVYSCTIWRYDKDYVSDNVLIYAGYEMCRISEEADKDKFIRFLNLVIKLLDKWNNLWKQPKRKPPVKPD